LSDPKVRVPCLPSRRKKGKRGKERPHLRERAGEVVHIEGKEKKTVSGKEKKKKEQPHSFQKKKKGRIESSMHVHARKKGGKAVLPPWKKKERRKEISFRSQKKKT